MEQQLQDWIDYCEGRTHFDKSHFYSLFMEGEADNGRRSTQELEIIFSFFPYSEDLLNRMATLFQKFPDVDNIQEHLLSATKLDLDQKKNILIENGADEVIQAIEKGIHYHSSSEIVLESRIEDELYGEFVSEIDFYAVENWIGEDDKYYALFEAFYGVVNDYQLSWYLGSPLIDSSVNFDFYFEVWKYGGLYSISADDGVIVSRRS